MDSIPQRIPITNIYRKILSRFGSKLWLPIKNPGFYRCIGLLLSFSYLFTKETNQKIIVLLFILTTDWLDGIAAQKANLVSKERWLKGISIDRISEIIISITDFNSIYGQVFLAIAMINIILSFYSLKNGKHILLPHRFVYLILLSIPFFLSFL